MCARSRSPDGICAIPGSMSCPGTCRVQQGNGPCRDHYKGPDQGDSRAESGTCSGSASARRLPADGRAVPLVLGHRGASAAAPENTLAAFARARELGADGVELDVRRTADGVLVVHHDPEVDGFGADRRRSRSQSSAPRMPSVPTLAEALDACRGLLVERRDQVPPVGARRRHRRRVSRARPSIAIVATGTNAVVVSSFDLDAVDRVRSFGARARRPAGSRTARTWPTRRAGLPTTATRG